MSSKSILAAILLGLLLTGCRTALPWENEPVANEVNLNFLFRNNLVEMNSVRLGGSTGRFILGTAAPRTIVDPSFGSLPPILSFGERDSVRISPAIHPLQGVAHAIVGADAWKNDAVTIDYFSGLVTWQKEGIKSGFMTLFRYPGEPMVEVVVDGRRIAAIVDTTSPDTLVLPAPSPGRRRARVQLAGTDFGVVDVQMANVCRARVGNRLLSRFLVTVDYGRRVVGLWRDPRTPL